MVVDIASHRQHYGLLAAYNPQGLMFAEGPQLEAYARLAATALDSATALETARREADRAKALLALAGSLAEITTVEEMARSLVRAIPAVIGADRAVFAIADRVRGTARALAVHGFDADSSQVVSNAEFPLGDPTVDQFVYTDPTTMSPTSKAVAMVIVPIMLDGLAEAWLTAGGAHHTVLTTAVGVEAFEDFAEIARTELLVIDEATTRRGFRDQVRWNQVYFRLAQGF